VSAARRQEEFISIRSRPRLPAPPIRPAPKEPPRQERTQAERARAAELMKQFHATYEREKDAKAEAERADIRKRYGMTPEVLATIRDQPLPEGMVQVSQSVKVA
jgi:hypothetical protein